MKQNNYKITKFDAKITVSKYSSLYITILYSLVSSDVHHEC